MPLLDDVRSRLADRRTWWFALALIPYVLLIARHWGLFPDLPTSDYSQYVAHARALLEGRSYIDTGYLFSPYDAYYAPIAYPPGFPLALLAGFAVFGPSIGVAKVVTLLLSAGLFVAAGVYISRERDWRMAVAVLLTLGLSPKFIEHSIAPMTDLPLATFVWIVLVLADREEDWTLVRAGLVTLFTGFAVLIRPHGLVLIPALGLWGLLNLRRHGWTAIAPAAALTAVTVVGRLIVGSESLRGFPSASRLIRNLVTPDLRYHHSVLESHLFPFPGDFPNDVFHVFTAGLMVLGLADFVRRNPRSLAVCFAVVYTLALGSLQIVGVRFAFPLYPLFVYGVVNGIRIVVEVLAPRRGMAVALGYSAVLAAVITARAWIVEPPLPRMHEPDYLELVEHIRGRVAAGEEMRIVSFRPRILALETGAPGMVQLRRENTEAHIAEWCRTSMTHAVLGGFGIGVLGTQATRRALETRPGAATVELSNDTYELVRLDRARLDCPAS